MLPICCQLCFISNTPLLFSRLMNIYRSRWICIYHWQCIIFPRHEDQYFTRTMVCIHRETTRERHFALVKYGKAFGRDRFTDDGLVWSTLVQTLQLYGSVRFCSISFLFFFIFFPLYKHKYIHLGTYIYELVHTFYRLKCTTGYRSVSYATIYRHREYITQYSFPFSTL